MDPEAGTGLDERLARLPRGIAPRSDLWPAIEARLARVETAPAGWVFPGGRLAALAAALVLMLVSSLATQWWLGVRGNDRGALALTGPAVPAELLGGIGLGDAYRLDRDQLALVFEDRLQALQPETRKAVLANLHDIRDALGEINTALAADPTNVLLQQLLVATYREELEVFDRVNRLTAVVPVRRERI